MIRPSSPLTMLLSRHTRRREFIVRRARDGTEDLTGRVLLLQRLPNLPLCFGKLPPSLVSVVPRLVKLAGARFELLFQLDRWIGLVANARSRLRSGRTKFAARWTIFAFARQDHLVGTVTGPPSGRPSQRSSLSILTEQHDETRASSLDHLVGACQQRDRRIEAERLGSCQVDDELKFVRKLDRQVAGLGAFENAIDVGCRAAVLIDSVNPVGRQTTFRDEKTLRIDRRQPMPGRKRKDLVPMSDHRRMRERDEAAVRLARECIDGGLDLGDVVHGRSRRLYAER